MEDGNTLNFRAVAKVSKILSDDFIAEKIGLPLETVLQLKAEKENPTQKEA